MNARRLVRRIGFHLLRLIARQIGHGGMSRLARFGERFGAWHWRLARKRRNILIKQMQRALPGHPDRTQVTAWLREAYRVNDRAILEILAMYSGTVSLDDISASVEVADLDQLDRALDRGRGVIMLGMHMGNGVAMAAHLARKQYPVSVIYRESGKIAEGFFRDGINALGMEAIPAVPAAVGVRRMLKALKTNRVLFILMDQASKNQGVLTPFLGKALHMPPGPAELARRTGAAVVPALLEGVSPRWRFRMGEIWLAEEAQSINQQVEILTRIMQQHIEKQPQWWTWHQRRWVHHAFLEPEA
jgi:phosphatidylinositol dimannoside acyltransferase